MQRRFYKHLLALLAISIAIAFLVFKTQGVFAFEDESTLRKRLSKNGQLDQIQNWVSNARSISDLQMDRLPQQLRTLGIKNVIPRKTDGQELYAEIVFSGGFRHQGLYIAPEPFIPLSNWPIQSRWLDTVWYYDDGAGR